MVVMCNFKIHEMLQNIVVISFCLPSNKLWGHNKIRKTGTYYDEG